MNSTYDIKKENEASWMNTLDVTMSGFLDHEIALPNGQYLPFRLEEFRAFWTRYEKPRTLTVNLVNIETFAPVTYPIIDVNVKKKNVSKLYEFFWEGWDNEKIYDVNVKVIGMKTMTRITMRSKEIFIVDESVQCLKNALDSCFWNIDSSLLA